MSSNTTNNKNLLLALKNCPVALDKILAKLSLTDLAEVSSIGKEYHNLLLRLSQTQFEQLKGLPDLHAPDSVLPIGVKAKFTKGDVVAHSSGWFGIVMEVAAYACEKGKLPEIDLYGKPIYETYSKKTPGTITYACEVL